MNKLILKNDRKITVQTATEPIQGGATLANGDALAKCLNSYGAVHVVGHSGTEPFTGVIQASEIEYINR